MTKQEFISKIEEYRSNSSNLLEGDGGYKIYRGMAHVISGYAEDLFALYIASNIKRESVEFFVDKVISMKLDENQRAISFKPDLSVVEDSIMTHYFDVKTNMGWNRDFVPYLEEKNKFIEEIKGKKAWINFKGERQDICISERIKYQMTIIYGWNINQQKLQDNLEEIKNLPNIDVQILYSYNLASDSYEINESGFDNVLRSVKS